MLPYVIIALVIFFFSFLDLVKIRKSIKKIIFIIIVIVLALFLGTRLVGPDLWTYESFYNLTPPLPKLLSEFPKYTILSAFEPLFLLSYGLFVWLGASFHLFNLVFTCIFIFLFTSRLHYYTRNTLIALMVFLAYGYISGFSAIRQVMAASIFFYSWKYLIDGKVWKYTVAIIIATLFHASAIILFIFCFVYEKKFKSLTIIIVLTVLILCIYSHILSSIAAIVMVRIPFISPAKVALYLDQNGSFLGSVSIFWIFLLVISLICREKLEKIEPNFNFYFNILWIGLVIYAISVGFGGFGRVLMYFKLVYLIILPLFVRLMKEIEAKILAVTIVALISMSLFFAVILTDTRYSIINRYLPYQSWLINSK